jgi:hypothetical protein
VLGVGVGAAPSANAKRGIPARYLSLYRQAGREAGVPWPALAAIGALETDHGRSRAPGVRSDVNRRDCCAGPMQLNTRDGPPSTWERYGVDGNHDGTKVVYDPDDAIPSAAGYLRALLRAADGNLSQALFGYNHSQAYVSDVLARARTYARLPDQELAAAEVDVATGCADTGDLRAGPANLRAAQRVASRGGFRPLPSWALAGGGPGAVDARLYGDVVWILRRYHLRVSAAREAGHNTHGDGTAVDLIPADGHTQAVWDAAARRLATRPRLDPSLRALRDAPSLPARARHPVHRLRRLPQPRLTAHLQRSVPRTSAPFPGPRRATAPVASPRPANR